ncbi:hypothetical protein BJ322DRAFT_1113327 [Thelephora terrestris]|uniref:Yeast cell wall synthesis Kre9/Knh1-like N-terminal domain-containing protein n=1 Tax=Thelephora terrestris TaxID=56493 RepID=A0A9P6H579_9AGAM|nr:hypothetical protein BJ322DRAFT_1113327 [Thelephora terrestris]
MRAFSVFSAILLLSVNAWAATIIEPSSTTVWSANNDAQGIAWTSVPTDPDSFSLQLANMAVSPSISIILKNNVSTAAGSTMVTAPSSGWPTGNGFQVNVVQISSNGTAILAQSPQFAINGTTTAFSSSVSYSGTSTGTSPGSTSTGKNGAVGLTVQTGFVAGLAIVGALLA